jgi:phosphoglycolate phosphatase
MARLIFDLDGTLVDSAPTIVAAANAMLGELGRAPLDRATVVGFVGHGMDALVDRVLVATGGVPEGGPEAARARYRALYAADPLAGTVAYPGVAAVLGRLAAAGHGLAVCTQKPAAPARALLEGLGLMPPVTGLTGGDSLAVLKPDPRLLAHAAAQLPPGPVVFVGDSETDAATAATAGVPFLLFLRGYRHGPLAAIARAGEFDDFAALPGLIDGVLAEAPLR